MTSEEAIMVLAECFARGAMSVLCVLTIVSATGPSVFHLDNGILFERRSDVILSDHSWSVVVNFDLLRLKSEYKQLGDIFRVVSGRMTHGNAGNLGVGYDMALGKMFSEYEKVKSELEFLVDLIDKRRVKRGWINAGGTLLKTVFGTMDSEDLRVLNERINNVERVDGQMEAEMTNRLLLIKNLEGMVANNPGVIRALLSELIKFQNQTQTFSKGVKIWQGQVNRILADEGNLVQIAHALVSARIDISRLRQALENSVNGRLSSVLIPPNMLITILERIRINVKLPLFLLVPPEHNYLYVYYQMAKTSAIVVGTQLKIIIDIPLGSRDSLFERYVIHPFPVFQQILGTHTQWNVGKTLLIDVERTYFTIWEGDEITSCRVGPLLLCPANAVLLQKAINSCEYDLFMRHRGSRCQQDAVKLESPFFKRVGQGWLFSLPSAVQVTLLCRNGTSRERAITMEIEGSGLLDKSSHCDILGDNFKLMAMGHGQLLMNGSFPALVMPNVSMSSGDSLMWKDPEVDFGKLKDELHIMRTIIEEGLT